MSHTNNHLHGLQWILLSLLKKVTPAWISHLYILPEAISRNIADLDEQEADFLNMPMNLHLSHKLITHVFENLKGRSFGTFLPKSMYYMNQKSEQLLHLAQYFSSDMSDAPKTLKKLDLYVCCHLIFCL